MLNHDVVHKKLLQYYVNYTSIKKNKHIFLNVQFHYKDMYICTYSCIYFDRFFILHTLISEQNNFKNPQYASKPLGRYCLAITMYEA